jgi:hypothetical protein
MIANQARNARLSVQINPKGDGASQKTAEMIKGLYRNIEVESRANMARLRALIRAIKCGRGYYRILKTYANDGDDDLDLIIEPILNQHSVFLDPFHQKPDGSDARWAFIVEDVPISEYRDQYPDSAIAEMSEGELDALGLDAPDWIGGTDESRTIRVAEYWNVTIDRIPAVRSSRQRMHEQRAIIWRKITYAEVLEQEEWEGRYIPIVQVIGEETHINGERRYTGVVRNGKDANRVYNVMASSEMESIGLTSKAPWIVAEGQLEGYEAVWRQAHLRSFAYLPYRPKSFGGELAPAPQRNTVEPAIQAISLARRQAREDVQTTTNTYDPSLGKGEHGDSGRKVQALQAQGEHGNSHFLTDFADISMTHEANIIIDLLPHVYDRQGRIVKILSGDDDTAQSVMLGQPFVPGPDGEPQPAQPGMPGAQVHDLSQGRYSCTVTVGKSFTTQHEEADAMFSEIAQAVPTMVPLFADLWVRSKDMPYANELADRFKAMLPPQLQQQEGQASDPKQAQAQVQQLTLQLQQAQQQLQEAASGVAKAQIDAQSRETIKAAEIASKEKIAQMQAQLDELKLQMDTALQEHKTETMAAVARLQQTEENRRHAATLAQSAELHHAAQAHELGLNMAEAHQEATQGQADRAHAVTLAAMKPKPKPGGQA